jgi:zinc protease
MKRLFVLCAPLFALLASFAFLYTPALAAPASAALAGPPPAGLVKHTTVEGITEYRLPNGLRILLAPDASKPTVTVNITYLVGSRHEGYGETGMAHLLEHLYFKGTDKVRNAWGEFTKRGMRANGSTWYDRTNYFASFAANEESLRWYLDWSADAMIHSRIARTDLDSEMTVVRNEMEMGENNPFRVLLERTLGVAYQWHNYGKSTIGARADVENVDIPRLQAFYRKYYQPDNAVLIVTGAFDQAKALQMIARAFGPIPRPKRPLPPTYTLDPVQDGERSVLIRRSGGTPVVVAAYHVMPGAHADYAALQVLNNLLGNGPSSRLHKNLVEKQLAAQAFSFSPPLKEPGFTVLGVALAPGQKPEAAREGLIEVVEGLGKQPVTAEEVERARTQWLKSWELSFTDPERVGVALSESIAQGDWRLFFLQRDRIRQVKQEDVQRVAGSYLLASNRNVGTYLPTQSTQDGTQRAPAPQMVDLDAALKDYRGDPNFTAGEAFAATPENIEKNTRKSALPVGMKLALLPKSTRGRRVNATLRLHLGTPDTLRGKEQIGEFAAAMLSRGTAKLSRQQIQDRFDQLKAQVAFGGGPTGVDVSIVTVRDHLPAVLELVGELLREAAFPAEQLEELRGLTLSAIEEARKQPDDIVQNALARHGNPYPRGDVRHARSFDEIVEDVRAVTAEQLRSFHREFYGASRAEFSAVGDFDPAQATAALERQFGQWTAKTPYERVPNPFVAVPAAELKFDTPDKQNAYFEAQMPIAISDNDADYPAVSLVNFVIGNVGDSRLWKRLRDKEGLSYDVRSTIEWSNHEPHSVWNVTAIYAPQNLERLSKGIREELERVVKDGLTEEELRQGVVGILALRQLSRAQDGNLASLLANNLHLGRTMMLSAQVDRKLRALTLAEANAALRKYLKPEQLVFGVGGEFTKAGVKK